MPTCQSCGKEWSWLETMKKIVRFKTRMKCHQCGEDQYQNQSSRNKMNLFALLPIILIPIYIIFDLSTLTILSFGLVLTIAVIFITPFMLKLSNKEEPIW